MELTSGQHELLEKITKWFHSWESHTSKEPHAQWFSYSGPAGSGKAQPDDTLIPTPNGNVKLKDICIGDLVFNMDGVPTKVLGIYPQGVKDTYEVIFSDGRKTKCCDEHIWTIRTTSGLKDVILRDLVEKYKKEPIAIPMHKCVQYPSHKIGDIRPYMLGLLLGYQQSDSEQFIVNSDNPCIINELSLLLECPPVKNSKNQTFFYSKILSRYLNTCDIPVIMSSLLDSDTLIKSIPAAYLFNSEDIRRDVLQGILDSSNYDDVLKIKSEKLLNDMIHLMRSLGICVNTNNMVLDAMISHHTVYLSYYNENSRFSQDLHEVCIDADNKSSNIDVYQTLIPTIDDIYITSIEYCGKTKQRCIYIDDPNHLYLTNDFIVTHNTTVVKELLKELSLDVTKYVSCAYTGNAVLQLQKHGLRAQTIHSLIYSLVFIEENGKRFPMFELKPYLDSNLRLIIVDEATMVNDDLCRELLSFNLPIIFIGDKNQLPPIFGESSVMNFPNYALTQIMRQKEDDPIIQLSQMVLRDVPLFDGKYGNSEVVRAINLDIDTITKYDQMITVTNKLRFAINRYVRKLIYGIKDDTPVLYDRVICRKNNWNTLCAGYPLTNGTSGIITDLRRHKKGNYLINFRPNYFNDILPEEVEYHDLEINTSYLCSMGRGEKPQYFSKEEFFEYSYAITVYLSQGAEWGRVLYFDSNFRDPITTKKSRYTAITRASNRITIVKGADEKTFNCGY